MTKQKNVFVGSNVTFVPAHDPTEGEVRSEVLDGLFLEIFLITNISTKSEHAKAYLIINHDLCNQKVVNLLNRNYFAKTQKQITIHEGGLGS